MESRATHRPTLGLLDAVSLIVGIVIGSGIYRTPPDVFGNVSSAAAGLGLWALGGLLAFLGALCYAELASSHPSNSGEYTYLSRAYGPAIGFAFAWAQLAVIRTGASIAPITYVFGDYAVDLLKMLSADGKTIPGPFGGATKLVLVSAAILILTAVNAAGLQPGRRLQNLLTATKILGISSVIGLGFWLATQQPAVNDASPRDGPTLPSLAMVFVLWAYAGWHEAAYVVADLRDGSRNIVRALLLGVGSVALIYLSFNFALLKGLGFQTVRESPAVASTLADKAFGLPGRAAMAALVMISALGGTNGTILTGGRFFGGFGALHPGFRWLARSDRQGEPLAALWVQAALSLFMVALIETGSIWKPWLGGPAASTDGFAGLVDCTAPVFWLFFLLTGLSLAILRLRDRAHPRPFRVPLFPVVVASFCGMCLYMLYSSTQYALAQRPVEALVVLGLLLAGVPVYLATRPSGSTVHHS